MRVRNSQSFLSLYYEQNAVEFAVGDGQLAESTKAWTRETKSLGQVCTPEPVAELLARWVMSRRPATVLDPAAGLGHLLHECRRLNSRAVLVAVECDAETLRQARRSAPNGTKLVLADYLLADAGMFDGIIANPPYVKAQRLDYTEADWCYLEELLGTPLDRLTNLYALFLLKIWSDLAPGGRAAVILPAEFLNANFGVEIKEQLLRRIRPAGIAVFSPEISLFEKALTTSALIFLEKGRAKDSPMHATRVASVDDASAFVDFLLDETPLPMTGSYRDAALFGAEEKWLNALFCAQPAMVVVGCPRRIGDYFACRRGIATGANEFFCLNESELREHGLDREHFDPCVTKAVDAAGLVFSPAKLRAVAQSERRCLLLNPKQIDAAVKRYLALGEKLGIPARHLPSHRPVWYLPENRSVAEVLVAVFSRESAKFILNTSGARNLTCFHGLYAKPGRENLAPAMTLFLNSTLGREAFTRVNRFYGDGLNKLEPKDVEAMPCPAFPPFTKREAAALTRELSVLENLPRVERQKGVDVVLARLLQRPSAQAA